LTTPNIITKCKQKDQQAFKTLYEACLPYVLAIVKDYAADPGYRKDLVQEIFAKVFLNLKDYDPAKGEFKAWLRKVAVNQCLMFHRDPKKKQVFEDLETAVVDRHLREEVSFKHLDPGASELVLSKMPEGYRKVFSLVVLEGYSHDEAGLALGISAETSRSQLTRSKQWLRQFFSNHKTLIENGCW
jgi:RNA polymerase sigma-70 factor (ECF subfamily)